MTIGAVFHYRRMLPEEWATTLGMTTQAILVDGGLSELRRVGCAVRIVAAGAGDFAFAVWHVRGPLQLGAPHLMAPKTKLWLSFFEAPVFRQRRVKARLMRQRLVLFLVSLMTINAGHRTRFVRAASPEELLAPRVALQTRGVFLGHRIS